MLSYLECSDEEFANAMSLKDIDVADISNDDLYILYTKFHDDALTCSRAGTTYSLGLSISSRKRAKAFLNELNRRSLQV